MMQFIEVTTRGGQCTKYLNIDHVLEITSPASWKSEYRDANGKPIGKIGAMVQMMPIDGSRNWISVDQTPEELFARIQGIVVNKWQPIGTAPRDGTLVIVGAYIPWHGWRSDFVYWHDGKKMWWNAHGLQYTPTHWMPEPDPPS